MMHIQVITMMGEKCDLCEEFIPGDSTVYREFTDTEDGGIKGGVYLHAHCLSKMRVPGFRVPTPDGWLCHGK